MRSTISSGGGISRKEIPTDSLWHEDRCCFFFFVSFKWKEMRRMEKRKSTWTLIGCCWVYNLFLSINFPWALIWTWHIVMSSCVCLVFSTWKMMMTNTRDNDIHPELHNNTQSATAAASFSCSFLIFFYDEEKIFQRFFFSSCLIIFCFKKGSNATWCCYCCVGCVLSCGDMVLLLSHYLLLAIM